MNIPFTIEPTGPNSANVVCRNVQRNGWKILSHRVPIEWKNEDQKGNLVALAKDQITKHIEKTTAIPYSDK